MYVKRKTPDTPMIRGWAYNTAVEGQLGVVLYDNQGCKWPIDLNDKPAKFCGLPPDGKSPYCSGHTKIGHNLK